MGYRSEWDIYIVGHPLKLEKFEQQVTNLFEKDCAAYTLLEEILSTKVVEYQSGQIHMSGDGWKCYAPWDNVIQKMEDLADELELDFAYARIGEDTNDNEARSTDGIDAYIARSIEIYFPNRPPEEYQEYLKVVEIRQMSAPTSRDPRWPIGEE